MSRKAYRDSYVSAHISNTVASQIEAMRDARKWTQSDLAAKIGTKQSRVSVLENPDNPNFEVKTLLKVASAFDVGLSIKFVPFSEVVACADNITPDNLVVAEFAKDSLAPSFAPFVFPWEDVVQLTTDVRDAIVDDVFRRSLVSGSYQSGLPINNTVGNAYTYEAAGRWITEGPTTVFKSAGPATVHVDIGQKVRPQNAMLVYQSSRGKQVLGLIE